MSIANSDKNAIKTAAKCVILKKSFRLRKNTSVRIADNSCYTFALNLVPDAKNNKTNSGWNSTFDWLDAELECLLDNHTDRADDRIENSILQSLVMHSAHYLPRN